MYNLSLFIYFWPIQAVSWRTLMLKLEHYQIYMGLSLFAGVETEW